MDKTRFGTGMEHLKKIDGAGGEAVKYILFETYCLYCQDTKDSIP